MQTLIGFFPKILASIVIAIITLYRKIVSPMLGQNCRFHPSCSAYAIEAIKVHGMTKGSWLSVKRVLKCHPFNAGGIDPVPKKINSNSDKK